MPDNAIKELPPFSSEDGHDSLTAESAPTRSNWIDTLEVTVSSPVALTPEGRWLPVDTQPLCLTGTELLATSAAGPVSVAIRSLLPGFVSDGVCLLRVGASVRAAVTSVLVTRAASPSVGSHTSGSAGKTSRAPRMSSNFGSVCTVVVRSILLCPGAACTVGRGHPMCNYDCRTSHLTLNRLIRPGRMIVRYFQLTPGFCATEAQQNCWPPHPMDPLGSLHLVRQRHWRATMDAHHAHKRVPHSSSLRNCQCGIGCGRDCATVTGFCASSGWKEVSWGHRHGKTASGTSPSLGRSSTRLSTSAPSSPARHSDR
jgi:hypothetical protein